MHCQPGPTLPWGSLPLSAPLCHPFPGASCTFTYIYQHCVLPCFVGKEAALHGLLAALPLQLLQLMHSFKSYLQAFYVVSRHWCMPWMRICMKHLCADYLVKFVCLPAHLCVCGCVYACVLPGQDKASHPPSPSRHTLLALHAPSHSHHPPPPLNAHTHTHTHLPHFACVIPASWPCWLIPLH